MKLPSPGTPVCIFWRDAETVSSEWVYDNIPEFSEADHVTYGVIRAFNKDAVQVSQTVAVERSGITGWLGVLEIPRGCIRRVEKLSV